MFIPKAYTHREIDFNHRDLRSTRAKSKYEHAKHIQSNEKN